jgi:hypothetical protein
MFVRSAVARDHMFPLDTIAYRSGTIEKRFGSTI